jgi:hypothetical protein
VLSALAASSTQSAAFGTATTCIQIFASTDVYVAAGASPVADNTCWLLKAGYATYAVNPGDKIAVRAVAEDGEVRIMEA